MKVNGSLAYSELVRFVRKHLWTSIGVSVGIGLLIQLSGVNGTGGEKRIFFNLIFSFWMGITMAVHWFCADRKYIGRLYQSGVSAWKILLSRTTVLFCVAIIHASVLFALSTIIFLNHGTTPSKTSEMLNELRYGSTNLADWGDEDSPYRVENEDLMDDHRDIACNEKIALAVKYHEVQQDGTWWRSDRQIRVLSFGRWYAFFLASFSGSWLGVVLTSFFRNGRPQVLIPFVTAVQIMFAKLTADTSSDLFCPLRDLFSTYVWWEPVHVLSLLTPMRYLVIVSEARSYAEILYSWDAVAIYSILALCFVLSGLKMGGKYVVTKSHK